MIVILILPQEIILTLRQLMPTRMKKKTIPFGTDSNTENDIQYFGLMPERMKQYALLSNILVTKDN